MLYYLLDDEIAAYVYRSPTLFADEPFCDEGCRFSDVDKIMVANVYKYNQRCLCMVAAGLCLPLIIFALFIRDPKLGDGQSLAIIEATESYPFEDFENVARKAPGSSHSAVSAHVPGSLKLSATPRSIPGTPDSPGLFNRAPPTPHTPLDYK